MRARINALAAQDAFLLGEHQLPFPVKREDLPGADADAGPAVHALALIQAHALIQDPDMGTERGHGVAHEPALVVRHLDKRLAFR